MKDGKNNPVIWVIGDIHGCIEELTQILVKIFEESDEKPIEIWSIGDAIDKGPDSRAVLETLFLASYPGVVIKSILGNHCEKFLRWCKAQDREDAGGKKNEVTDRWAFAAIRDFQSFVEGMPLYKFFPEYNVLLVHGGIDPRMTELPPTALMEANKYQKNILRLRYVSADGRMIPLGDENLEQGDKWWADVYDGRFGTIIYGHQASDEIQHHPHAIGLDTGCVYGNKLSALRLSKDGNHKLIQVNAKAKYAKAYDEE